MPFPLLNLFCFGSGHSCSFTIMFTLTNSEPVFQILTTNLNVTFHYSSAFWTHPLTSPQTPWSICVLAELAIHSFPHLAFLQFSLSWLMVPLLASFSKQKPEIIFNSFFSLISNIQAVASFIASSLKSRSVSSLLFQSPYFYNVLVFSRHNSHYIFLDF